MVNRKVDIEALHIVNYIIKIRGLHMPTMTKTERIFPEGEISCTALGKLWGVSRQRAWQILNERKHKAHVFVTLAIELGLLRRPKACPLCKEEKLVHAHHPDYSKPLDVEWACAKCHNRIHPSERRSPPKD